MLALLLILPLSPIAHDRCDLVELNHFYDEQGRPVFDQLIWYDWHGDDSRYHVVAWRLVAKAGQIPQRDWQHGGYTARWQDGEHLRRVRAESFRETWTQFDPELCEREYRSKDARRGLR